MKVESIKRCDDGAIQLLMDQESIVEDYAIAIVLNYKLDGYDIKHYSCPHVKGGRLRAVVQAWNEGQYNCTIVCLECLQGLDIDALHSTVE